MPRTTRTETGTTSTTNTVVGSTDDLSTAAAGGNDEATDNRLEQITRLHQTELGTAIDGLGALLQMLPASNMSGDALYPLLDTIYSQLDRCRTTITNMLEDEIEARRLGVH